MLSQARLKELLHYDPETGIFTWIKSARCGWNGKPVGSEFKGKASRTVYLRAKIDGKNYLLHRLAWLYQTGEIPEIIDHRDNNGLNNSWFNLRPALNSQNIANSATKSNNSSGVKNVHWETSADKWRGTFCTTLPSGKRKVINVGLFTKIEDAEQAVRKKREELHGEFARHE